MPSPSFRALVAALAVGAAHALPQSGASSATATAAVPSSTPSAVDYTDVIAKLRTDPDRISRFQDLLTKDGQILTGDDLAKATVYDFTKGGYIPRGTQGGLTNTATTTTFPILLDSGLTSTIASLGPCGIFLPHVHPRANEWFTVIEGEVDFGYMVEIGLLMPLTPGPQINGHLAKYSGTLFPQGSIHYQVNDSPDCKPATILATLSSDDPGTTTVLQTPAGVNATVGARSVDQNEYAEIKPLLPPYITSVIEKCIARCK